MSVPDRRRTAAAGVPVNLEGEAPSPDARTAGLAVEIRDPDGRTAQASCVRAAGEIITTRTQDAGHLEDHWVPEIDQGVARESEGDGNVSIRPGDRIGAGHGRCDQGAPVGRVTVVVGVQLEGGRFVHRIGKPQDDLGKRGARKAHDLHPIANEIASRGGHGIID